MLDQENKNLHVKEEIENYLLYLHLVETIVSWKGIANKERYEVNKDHTQNDDIEEKEQLLETLEEKANGISKVSSKINKRREIIKKFIDLGTENITLDEKIDKKYFSNQIDFVKNIVYDFYEVKNELDEEINFRKELL